MMEGKIYVNSSMILSSNLINQERHVLLKTSDTGRNYFLCNDCKGTFFSYPYCEFCGEALCQFSSCTRHWTSHRCFQTFTCFSCNKTFCSEEHKKIHSFSQTISNLLKLMPRARIPESKSSAKEQAELIRKRYPCNQCDKSFDYVSNLKDHYRIHTGEKPFVCEVCKSTFLYKTSLKAHMRTHTDEKRFVCEVCERAFKWKCNLKKHVRTHAGKILTSTLKKNRLSCLVNK